MVRRQELEFEQLVSSVPEVVICSIKTKVSVKTHKTLMTARLLDVMSSAAKWVVSTDLLCDGRC